MLAQKWMLLSMNICSVLVSTVCPELLLLYVQQDSEKANLQLFVMLKVHCSKMGKWAGMGQE